MAASNIGEFALHIIPNFNAAASFIPSIGYHLALKGFRNEQARLVCLNAVMRIFGEDVIFHQAALRIHEQGMVIKLGPVECEFINRLPLQAGFWNECFERAIVIEFCRIMKTRFHCRPYLCMDNLSMALAMGYLNFVGLGTSLRGCKCNFEDEMNNPDFLNIVYKSLGVTDMERREYFGLSFWRMFNRSTSV